MSSESSLGTQFEEYVAIIRRLRRECPWDREQTHHSIRPHLIEEAYETVEAIDHGDQPALKSELGDLLLHITLHAIMSEEESAFSIADVLAGAKDKMIRRHPHVFGEAASLSAEEITHQWERSKLLEGRTSAIEGVPKDLPSLLRAWRLQDKAAKVGFDWKERREVLNKVNEEIRELEEGMESGHADRIEDEFGDLLFALVNYARFLKVNPEVALRRSTEKFIRRFTGVEQELARRGKTSKDSTLQEMDAIWDTLKAQERSAGG